MGLFDNLESRLSSVVNGAFAKAFKSSVQPVEIASAIRTAMDDKAAVVGRGRTIVPNLYTIQLSPTDYDQLSAYAEGLTDELVAAAEDHADSQRYHPAGPVRVVLTQDDRLETGVFKLRPASAKDPWARAEPSSHAAVGDARRPEPRPEAHDEHRPQRRSPYEDRVPSYDDPAGPQDAYSAGAAHVPGGVAQGGLARAAYGLDDEGPARVAPMRDVPSREVQDRWAPDPRDQDRRDQDRRDRDHRDLQDPRELHDPDAVEPTREQAPVRAARPRLDPTRRPWLDIDGDRYPLLGAITVVGRDGVADIVLDDPGISRRHAEIRITTDGPHHVGQIRDLGSTNGTFVEGHRITSQRLTDGDRVTIGRTSFTFRLGKP